jgi:hypothetical protein
VKPISSRAQGFGVFDTKLLGGRVQLVFADMSAIEFIKTGKLFALAVTTATPQDILPGVPTVGEFVPGYEASTWYGIGAPSNTPLAKLERFEHSIEQWLELRWSVDEANEERFFARIALQIFILYIVNQSSIVRAKLRKVLVVIRIEFAKCQVSKLLGQFVHSQSVRKRDMNIHSLFGDAVPQCNGLRH